MRIDLEVVRHPHHDDRVIRLIAEAEAGVVVVAMTIVKLSDRVNVEVQYSKSNRSPLLRSNHL